MERGGQVASGILNAGSISPLLAMTTSEDVITEEPKRSIPIATANSLSGKALTPTTTTTSAIVHENLSARTCTTGKFPRVYKNLQLLIEEDIMVYTRELPAVALANCTISRVYR